MCRRSPTINHEKPSIMPTTSRLWFRASSVTALMVPLIPGAGPPPTRMPTRLCAATSWLFSDFIGVRPLIAARPAHKDLEGGEKSSGMLREPQHERKTFNHFYRSPRGSRRANEGLLRNLLG